MSRAQARQGFDLRLAFPYALFILLAAGFQAEDVIPGAHLVTIIDRHFPVRGMRQDESGLRQPECFGNGLEIVTVGT